MALSKILPACHGIHTWGSFKPLPQRQPDGTEKLVRMCPHCTMTMAAFAKIKTRNRTR